MDKKAVIALLSATVLLGSSGVFIKQVDMPASSLSFIRMGVPLALVSLYLIATRKAIFATATRTLWLASGLNALRMAFFFTAYIFTTISNAVLVSYTWPIFAAVFSFFILKEQLSLRQGGLLFLSFMGIVLVYINEELHFQNRDFIGMTAALASAMGYALSIVLFKKEAGKYAPQEMVFYQNFLGAFIFLPFFLLHRPWPAWWEGGLIATYAFLIGLVGFGLFFYALKRLPATQAAMLSYVEIISALAFGIFLLGEKLSWNVIAGGSLIVLSSALLRLYPGTGRT
ncbi:MAG: DMT family transporter [Bacteroidota bacterium]